MKYFASSLTMFIYPPTLLQQDIFTEKQPRVEGKVLNIVLSAFTPQRQISF